MVTNKQSKFFDSTHVMNLLTILSSCHNNRYKEAIFNDFKFDNTGPQYAINKSDLNVSEP